MIVLGIDTSGYTNAIGVVDGDRVLADRSFDAKTDSLEQIVADIDGTLKSAGLALEDVPGIGVGLGPGSWTGIRVGVTVGKMLAFSAGKPVAGVSTLEALAYRAGDKSDRIWAVVGAGTGASVYAASYVPADGGLALDGDYFYGDVEALLPKLINPLAIVVSGGETCRRLTGLLPEGEIIESSPSGGVVALLANRRLEKGAGDDVLSLTPLYLKESTAKALVNKYKGTGAEG